MRLPLFDIYEKSPSSQTNRRKAKAVFYAEAGIYRSYILKGGLR
jgi:hypothetical protein